MSFDEEQIKKAWVKRVKELMPQCGFQTYQDLAYKSRVSAGSLNQAMRGMHLPRQTTIDKIATALGTTSQFLLYGDTMKVVKKAPFLPNAKRIYDWIYGNIEDFETVHYVEVDSTLELTEEAFAWVVDQNDMTPYFFPGDLVLIEPKQVETIGSVVTRSPEYVLSIELEKPLLKPARTLFGKIHKTNAGLYIAPCNESYPSVYVADNVKLVGVVIQSVRTFKTN